MQFKLCCSSGFEQVLIRFKFNVFSVLTCHQNVRFNFKQYILQYDPAHWAYKLLSYIPCDTNCRMKFSNIIVDTQRVQKLIYVNLFTDCFMKISLHT